MAKQKVLDLDIIAKRYGVRPSEIAKGSRQDFALDLLVAQTGAEGESKAIDEAMKKAKKGRRR